MEYKSWKTLVCNFMKGFLRQTNSSRGFRRVDYDLMAERGEDKELLDLFTKTFSSSKHHRVVLVGRHVSTREIRWEYFQERPLHRSLQESTRSVSREEFTASSLSHSLARHDGRVSKNDRSRIWSWIYITAVMTGNACLVTSWRTKDTRAGIGEREMSYSWTKWYIKNHLNELDSFEAHCLGSRSTREKRQWMIVQQIFLDPWKKTLMTA